VSGFSSSTLCTFPFQLFLRQVFTVVVSSGDSPFFPLKRSYLNEAPMSAPFPTGCIANNEMGSPPVYPVLPSIVCEPIYSFLSLLPSVRTAVTSDLRPMPETTLLVPGAADLGSLNTHFLSCLPSSNRTDPSPPLLNKNT